MLQWGLETAVAVLALLLLLLCGVLLWHRSQQLATLRQQYAQAQRDYEWLNQQHASQTATCQQLEQDNELLREQLQEQERELIRSQSTHLAQQQAAQSLHEQLKQSQEQMAAQFQQLAQTALQQHGQSFQQMGQQSLQQLLQPLQTQIDAFQQRLNQVHTESVRGQTQLATELQRVMEVGLKMSGEAQHLSQALKGDKKRMGTWGEWLLTQTLEQMGLVEGEHFLAQPRYRDAQGQLHIPDIVVLLPDQQHLVIDSKTSLVDYDRAQQAENNEEYEQALQAHIKALERHVDDLAKKRYHSLPQLSGPDFVLMFVPLEAAYLAALAKQPDLFDYGLKKNIIIVSHTSLVPILGTIAQLWTLAKSHRHAHELAQQASSILHQLDRVCQRLKRVGDGIQQLSNHYNSSVTALVGQQGLYRKLQRFQELSQHRLAENPEVQSIRVDLQQERLGGSSTPAEDKPQTNEGSTVASKENAPAAKDGPASDRDSAQTDEGGLESSPR